MRAILAVILLAAALAACSDPHRVPLPRDADKMDTLEPVLKRLSKPEQELLLGYASRISLAAGLRAAAGAIPEGMTVGKAIEEQRQFEKAKAAAKAEKEKRLAARVAEREKILKPMLEAVTVELVSKKIVPDYGTSGKYLLDENFNAKFSYHNNTDREIAGVKGLITIKDLFGDDISKFLISNDSSIKPGQTVTWEGSRSVKYPRGDNNDRRLAELPPDKLKLIWEPRSIVFADGTKLDLPIELAPSMDPYIR